MGTNLGMKNNKEKLVGFLLGIMFLPVFAGQQMLETKSLEDLVKDAEKNEMPNDNGTGSIIGGGGSGGGGDLKN